MKNDERRERDTVRSKNLCPIAKRETVSMITYNGEEKRKEIEKKLEQRD
jgi:hypothetical protein